MKLMHIYHTVPYLQNLISRLEPAILCSSSTGLDGGDEDARVFANVEVVSASTDVEAKTCTSVASHMLERCTTPQNRSLYWSLR